MSIIRVIAVDPRPRDPREDIVVYQVPEHSRACELLFELFAEAGIEWEKIEIPRRGRLSKPKGD